MQSWTNFLHAAVDEIVDAAADPNRVQRIENVLRDITHEFHSLRVLVHEEEDDEVLLHADPSLTIYHITLSPGLQYPPHNHLMDAMIAIYSGEETNFVYPMTANKLGVPERHEATAPAVVHLPEHTVHSVANTGIRRSGALHVYLGDLPHARRQLWSFETGQAEPFDNNRYLAGVRRIH